MNRVTDSTHVLSPISSRRNEYIKVTQCPGMGPREKFPNEYVFITPNIKEPKQQNSVSPATASQPRVQPVALEISVSVNGVRTVEGSDKREPFSETTQT